MPLGDPSIANPPLEEWLIGLVRRCATYRARKVLPTDPERALPCALETVFGMFQRNLEGLLVGVPRAAPGTNHLMVRFRVHWANYRNIARAADDCLVRVFHESDSHSLDRVA